MKRNLTPKFKDWPPNPPMGGGRISLAITRHEDARRMHLELIRRFEDYEEILRTAIESIPADALPLLVGRDIPDFLMEMIEKRIKKGVGK